MTMISMMARAYFGVCGGVGGGGGGFVPCFQLVAYSRIQASMWDSNHSL